MDTGTLCLLAIIVIAVLFLLPRLMSSQGRRVDFSRPGAERPRIDDPNIGGGGSIGRRDDSPIARGGERPRVDDPNIGGGGSFGRDRGDEPRDRERREERRSEARETGGGFSGHIGGSRPPSSGGRDRDEAKSGGADLGSIIDQMRGDDDQQPRASSRDRGDDAPRRSSRDRDDDEPPRSQPRSSRDDDEPRRERDDSPRPTHDDPNIGGQGSFGRDKD